MKTFESLFAAYLIVWGILFVYHLTVGARVNKLQDEIKRLKEILEPTQASDTVNR